MALKPSIHIPLATPVLMVPEYRLEFAKMEVSSGVNGLFRHDGLKGILAGKDYGSVYYIFPFFMSFADRCLGRLEPHE